MRKASRAPAALICLVLVALLAGCGDPKVTPEARELLDRMNGHARESVKYLEAVDDTRKRFSEIVAPQDEPGAETVEKAGLLLDSAESSEEKALSELKQMESSLAELGEMEVGPELHKYSRMKLEAVREQEKYVETELEAMSLRKQVIASFKTDATLGQLLDLQARITELETTAKDYALRAKALHEDANDYYKEKKLG